MDGDGSQAMTRVESELVVIGAMFCAGLIARHEIKFRTLVNIPVMSKCPGCGRLKYSFCPDCEYRRGGALPDTEDEHAYEEDLVDEMRAAELDPGWRVQNELDSWRVPSPRAAGESC